MNYNVNIKNPNNRINGERTCVKVLDFTIDISGAFCYKTSEKTSMHAYTGIVSTQYRCDRLFYGKDEIIFKFTNVPLNVKYIVHTELE